ncbi:hypothetical protein [Devosia sp.]|uniref:hypothetical protein n=1 Tax=Devosia sp. TaxID=1871048 RepID=UPI003A9360A5
MCRLAPALALIAVTLAPVAVPTSALAAGRPSCDAMELDEGVNVGFGITFHFGDEIRDRDVNDYSAMIALRQRGVDARRVTRTSDGCLQVLVRTPNGWDTQYYHPVTYEWVYG